MIRLFRDDNGSVLTEYGLLVVLIAVGLIAVLIAFRGSITSQFQYIMSQITGAK